MGHSLDPSAWHRLTAALRPDWTRTATARRVAAAGLVLLAGLAAVRADPRGEQSGIVVAARDLAPGVELTAEDVRIAQHSSDTLPDGAQRAVSDLLGITLAGPVRRGEVLTDVRLLGPRLAESAVGPDARIVPLHLADAAMLDLIRPGDVVDVLTVTGDQPGAAQQTRPLVVATDAVVVLVSEKPKGGGSGSDRVALVALPARAANDVAGAGLTQAVTLVMH